MNGDPRQYNTVRWSFWAAMWKRIAAQIGTGITSQDMISFLRVAKWQQWMNVLPLCNHPFSIWMTKGNSTENSANLVLCCTLQSALERLVINYCGENFSCKWLIKVGRNLCFIFKGGTSSCSFHKSSSWRDNRKWTSCRCAKFDTAIMIKPLRRCMTQAGTYVCRQS